MKTIILITDIESTGLHPEHGDEIVQIAVLPVKTSNFSKFEQVGDIRSWVAKPFCDIKHQLLSPELEAEIFASKNDYNLLTQEVDAYLFELREKNKIEKLMFGGWNAQFDWRFLQQIPYDNMLKHFDYHIFDFMNMALPSCLCKSLDEAASFFGFKRTSKFHSGIEDVSLIYSIAKALEFGRKT